MGKCNIVYIAQSLDGYISDRNGKLDWLNSIPNPENIDMGYNELTENIDAIIMGRKTFETVCSFNINWPYQKPVFVLSRTLKKIPSQYSGKAEIINSSIPDLLADLNQKGYNRLYIDGGKTIQSFLKEGLINELIITTMPILLGGGSKLFSDLPNEIKLEHLRTEVFLNQVVQSHYKLINARHKRG